MMGKALVLAASLAANTCFADCPTESAVNIYPTARTLPENLLRMYVYFPRPMMADQGLANVRLLDSSGLPVQGAFLSNREDLWSPDRRRLTVFFDPGRVKTRLAAHESMGRALVVGESYSFVVSADAMDAVGCSLGQDGILSFKVGAADLETPSPADWSLTAPRSGGIAPLIVDLGTAHDHLSLAFQLRVVGTHGKPIAGAIDLREGESSWIFTPASPWKNEPYALRVGESLEDLAGNRPGVLFDRPLDQKPTPWVDHLWFTPG